MRFKGEPGMHVIDSATGRQVGRFDDNGYLEIEDKKMEQRMKSRFAPAPERQKKAAAPKGKEVN